MEEVIAGLKAFAAQDPETVPSWYRRTGGRECYNTNVLLANAYQETFDPVVKKFCLEWKNLLFREYSEEINAFRPPQIYMYNALVLQQRLWRDEKLKAIMLRNLADTQLSTYTWGGPKAIHHTIANGWAHAQTGDRRYGQVAWDVARCMADVTPDADLDKKDPPPYAYDGNDFYRRPLLPMLIGMTVGRKLNLPKDRPFVFRDTFFSLDANAKGGQTAKGLVFVRPRREGDLRLRVAFAWLRGKARVRVLDGGKVVAEVSVAPRRPRTAKLEGPGYGVRERGPRMTCEVAIRAAQPGKAYRVVLEGGNERSMALVLGDARIVHHLPTGRLFAAQDLAGQYYRGAAMFTRTTADEISITSRQVARAPYTIRDAETWERLGRSNATDRGEMKYKVGKGRRIAIIGGGYGAWTLRTVKGVEPYYSATREAWFLPE